MQLCFIEMVVLDPDILEVIGALIVLFIAFFAKNLKNNASVMDLLPIGRPVNMMDITVGNAEIVHDLVTAFQQIRIDRNGNAVTHNRFSSGRDVNIRIKVVIIGQFKVMDFPILLISQHDGPCQANLVLILFKITVNPLNRIVHLSVGCNVRLAKLGIAVHINDDGPSLRTGAFGP
ncbi:hypothetical protein D3C77_527440 [compost metagenome]